jgi:hypothetical protein
MAQHNGTPVFHVELVVPAGTSQATATQIPVLSSPALVLAAGNSWAAIKLPVASKGKRFDIKNTNPVQLGNLLVFPANGDSINALGANASISLPPVTAATFIADASRTWHTVPVVPE